MTRRSQAIPRRIVPDMLDETIYLGEHPSRLWRLLADISPSAWLHCAWALFFVALFIAVVYLSGGHLELRIP